MLARDARCTTMSAGHREGGAAERAVVERAAGAEALALGGGAAEGAEESKVGVGGEAGGEAASRGSVKSGWSEMDT